MLCYKTARSRASICGISPPRAIGISSDEHVDASSPGNNGYMGLCFPLLEIISSNAQDKFLFKDIQPVESIPENAHPRAILESQFLSMKSRIAVILPEDARPLHRLILTGGSSQNQTIRQLAADLFRLPTYVAETKEAAGLDGALLALFTWWREQNGGKGTFDEIKGNTSQANEIGCGAPVGGLKSA